jgi:hypothetical protein
MQQRYRPTPTNLMHITLDLRCNKAFKNRRVVVCSGLALIAAVVVLVEVKFDTNTMGVSPSPKLDQHDPKRSRINYTYTNDARLNMMECMS